MKRDMDGIRAGVGADTETVTKTIAATGTGAGAGAAVKTAALAAVALTLLAGCGEPTAKPMDDEYAGNSGETERSQEAQSQGGETNDGSAGAGSGADEGATKQDTGNYADGTYSINGQYGPIGEDTIDVHVTVKSGNVDNVEVIGHPFTSISKKHQDAFASAINGVVDGKPLKDLKVDKVAGASWTSEAFNKALEVARQEASVPAE